jgi:phytol kinase
MTWNNTLGLLVCFGYVFAVIGLAEGLRRRLGYSSDFTRKVVHIGVGMMSWFIIWLFDNPWPFIFACLTFTVINLLDWRYGFFAAMSSSDRGNLGTVYFPLAAAFTAIVFWEYPPLMVAALMPLTWGDGLAAVFGRNYGRHAFMILGNRRSLEGSAAFFFFGLIFTWLALWYLPGAPALSPAAALVPALAVITVTTLVEALSIFGIDNLTITGAAVALFYIWPFGLL